MASYFDELHIEENETPTDRIARMGRETYLALFYNDPLIFSEILDVQRVPPASKSEIEKLEQTSSDELLNEECHICLCKYRVEEKALIMPCKHIFHEDCLKTWLKKSNYCPLCKFELKTEFELYELYREEMKNRKTREENIAILHQSMFS